MWTIIEVSNFHSLVEDFCYKNKIDICDNNIILKMIENRYSFANIPPSIIKRLLAELRIQIEKEEYEESLFKKAESCPYCQKNEEEEYNLNSNSE